MSIGGHYAVAKDGTLGSNDQWAMVDANRYDEFATLLQQTTRQLLTYLNAVLFRWDDADDVFQETCLVLWEKFDEFQPGTNFLGWALCVARNKAMSFQAARARRSRFWGSQLQNSLMAAVSDRGSAAANASADVLSTCIDRLCQADRQLVRRCYAEDVPIRQVAAQLGRSPQSVHNSLRRIRAALLECINQARENDR
jgi:RNA polymerase sigma-70 factor (ECF subfamily)